MSNYTKLIFSKMLFAVCATFTGGAFLQGFLKSIEVAPNIISLYSTVILVSQIIALILAFFFIDRLKNIHVISSFAIMSYITLCLSILYLNNFTEIPANPFPLFLSGIIVYFLYGAYASVDYKLPLVAMDKKIFGKYVSVCAVLQQVFSILLTVIMSILINFMEYKTFVNIFVVIAGVFGISSSVLLFTLKIDYSRTFGGKDIEKRKFKLFYKFFFADFFRGLSTGVMSLTIVFASVYGIADQKISTYFITLSGIAAACGSFLTIFFDKDNDRKKIFMASLISAPLCVLMFIFTNSYVFLIVVFLRTAFSSFGNIFIPIYLSKIIENKDLGSYTSRKMIVEIAGQSVATFILGFIINSPKGILVAIIFAAVFEILSGFLYWFVKREVQAV